jgi:dienelactone hydrolase
MAQIEFAAARTLESGIIERPFTASGANGRPVPGVLWTRAGAPPATPLILIGHGGGGNKFADGNLANRDYYTGERGIATAAIDGPVHGDRGPVTDTAHPAYSEMWRVPTTIDDMNADWARTLDGLLALGEFDPSAIGYHGLSMGTMFGLPYVASESRLAAAVLGLCGLRGSSIVRSGIEGRLAADAPRVTLPLLYHVQWDDERFDRDSAFELYGMLGSTDKRLQSTPGLHGGTSPEATATLRLFLANRLLAPVPAPVA